MNWLTIEFKPACHRKGINLMRDDMVFIEECLSKIPAANRKELAREYMLKWLEGMQLPLENRTPEGSGRYMANSWIRHVTSRN